MASKGPNNDWKTVIQKNWTTLVSDLNAKDLLDLLLERQFLSSLQYRDISELQLTSDKNRQVLDLATKKGIKGYNIFKQCLRESGYEHLADLLDSTEKELKKKQVVIPKKVVVPKKVFFGDKVSARSNSHSKSESNTERFSKPDGEVIYTRGTPVMSQETRSQVERRPPSSQSSSDVGNAKVIMVTEADLMTIANNVLGDNWELLTPSLGIDYVTRQQVIADNPGDRVHQIFVVLCKWMYSLGSEATLQELEKKLRDAPPSVTIDRKKLDDLMQKRRNAESSQQGRMTEASLYSDNGIAHRMENVSLNSPDQIGHTRRLGGDVSNSFQIDHSVTTGGDTSGPNSADNNSNVDLVQQNDGLDIVDAQPYNTSRQDQFKNIRRGLDELERSIAGQSQPSNSVQAVTVQPQSTSHRQVPPSRSHSQAPVEGNNDMLDGPTGIFGDKTKEKGRLKVLNSTEISVFKIKCDKLIGEGAFGKVYVSEREIPGLKLKVVMKIIDNPDNIDKMRSITNEKLASRTLHFGIVPLLMYGSDEDESGKSAFYFFTPFLENGNLYDAIQKDKLENDQSKKKLTRGIRLKILFHIASAIHFLHTPVGKFRHVVCHMDIKTLNIVLDSKYNARLIDFGLAREMLEGNTTFGTTRTTLPGTDGYFPTASFRDYTIYSDYYSFGVVILELLTGCKPVSDDKKTYLKKKSKYFIRNHVEKMWKDKDKLFPVTEELHALSVKCRESCNEKNISSEKIVKTLDGRMKLSHFQKWTYDEQIKCDICMQYDAVSNDVLQHDRDCKMKVCVSCMRNSYCNPIWCHTCSQEIVPNIGRGWVGMILAGNDTKNKTLAQVFSEDGEKIKTVVTSKSPLVMGISEELLIMVKPENPGEKENMRENLMQAFDKLKGLLPGTKQTQNTLFLYYSGHYFTEKGFQLGHDDEFITLDEFQNCLKDNIDSSIQIRMIVLLDCCYAPGIFQFPHSITLIQINSSTPNAPFRTDKGGSIFQRLFTQAFTGQALTYKCRDITDNTKECIDCKIDGDFVTVENLQAFIDKHYKACVIQCESKPTIFVQNAVREDVRIGYVVNFHVDMSLNFEWKGKIEKIDIPPRTFSSIVELKTILFDRVVEWLPGGQGPRLSTVGFQDILLLFTTSGPDSTKPKHRHELDTIEKIIMAWESRRQLYVTLRDASEPEDKLVGVFSGDMSKIIDDLLKRDIKMCDDKTAEVIVQCETYLKEVLEKFCSNQDLDDLRDVAEHLLEEQDRLKDKPGVTKLKVKFPYEEHGDVKYRKDFLCFNLVKDS